MELTMRHDVESIMNHFQIVGDCVEISTIGIGHINDTYAVTVETDDGACRYVAQRINHHVFKNPLEVMANIERVTTHIRNKLVQRGEPDIDRRVLSLVPATDGRTYYSDSESNVWRVYTYIERARTYPAATTEKQAYEAAYAFGDFLAMLQDMPGPRLYETIADFHNTPKRFANFETALAKNVRDRAESARDEIDFAFARKHIVDKLSTLHAAGEIPERITHNDTKFNNVMFDNDTGRAVCIVDLDTVMQGLAILDFGDMVRSGAITVDEDQPDITRVDMQMPVFEALAHGYLDAAGKIMTKTEQELMPFAAKLITFETGLRFLTDYLEGDTYFKVEHDRHNLDRCGTQFKLVESIEMQENDMLDIVRSLV